jgi:hypothetical protein
MKNERVFRHQYQRYRAIMAISLPLSSTASVFIYVNGNLQEIDVLRDNFHSGFIFCFIGILKKNTPHIVVNLSESSNLSFLHILLFGSNTSLHFGSSAFFRTSHANNSLLASFGNTLSPTGTILNYAFGKDVDSVVQFATLFPTLTDRPQRINTRTSLVFSDQNWFLVVLVLTTSILHYKRFETMIGFSLLIYVIAEIQHIIGGA